MDDFILHGGPTECLLTPRTDHAREWFRLHIPEDANFLGSGVLVLQAFLDDILKGIDDDGLTVQDERRLLI